MEISECVAILSSERAGFNLIEVREVRRTEAGGKIPAGRGWIVQVIAACDIVEGGAAFVDGGVEELRRVAKGVQSLEGIFID